MAIQLDLQESSYGVPFQGAYVRIVNVNIMRIYSPHVKFKVVIDVSAYATNPQEASFREVDMRRYQCLLEEIEVQSGDNFLARCYEWVMAQPDMVGALAV